MFRHWQPGDDLAVSDLKISEPTPDKRLEIPDILLVPLLAFDNSGHRLGFGGGYYDRTLSDLRAKRDITAIGFAYAGQEVDNIPQESFDQRLDWVMTEQGLHKFNTDKVL